MRIFIDMDGVLVDFDRYMREHSLTADEVKAKPGAYAEMQPMPDAIESVRTLIAQGHDVWIASKPPTAQPHAYADKVRWILTWLPELSRKIILTHDKGLLGGEADILIDDRPHKANCEAFKGYLIVFGSAEYNGWEDVMCMIEEPDEDESYVHLSQP